MIDIPLNDDLKALIFSKLEEIEFPKVAYVSPAWSRVANSLPVLHARYRDINATEAQLQRLFRHIMQGYTQTTITNFSREAIYTKAFFRMSAQFMEINLDRSIKNLLEGMGNVNTPLGQIILKDSLVCQIDNVLNSINDIETSNISKIINLSYFEMESIKSAFPFAYEIISTHLSQQKQMLNHLPSLKIIANVFKSFLLSPKLNQTMMDYLHENNLDIMGALHASMIQPIPPVTLFVLANFAMEQHQFGAKDDLLLLSLMGLTPDYHNSYIQKSRDSFIQTCMELTHMGMNVTEEDISHLFSNDFNPQSLMASIKAFSFLVSRNNPSILDQLVQNHQLTHPQIPREEIQQRRDAVRRVLGPDEALGHHSDDLESSTPPPAKKSRKG